MFQSSKKTLQRKLSQYTYNSDGVCILGYGFDSKRLHRGLLLLLSNPSFGKVCCRGMTAFKRQTRQKASLVGAFFFCTT